MSFNETDSFTELAMELAGASTPTVTDPTVEIPPEDNALATDDEAPEVTEPKGETEETETEPEEGDEVEEGSDEAPKPKGKKSAEERIREVVTKQRTAERELASERAEKAEILRRLQELENVNKPTETPTPQTPQAQANEFGLVEPKEDDVDANGESKYPLGSFDPNFMRDITRYDRAVEKAYEAKVAELTKVEAAKQEQELALFNEWEKRLAEAEKTSPTIRDKAQGLVDEFFEADPQHMQVVAQTIMQMDNGPAVLEYLADNLDEAEKITKMPTNKALLYLGRLDAGFEPDEAPAATQPPKATKAPTPPANLARGSAGGRSAASLYDKMLADFR